MLSDQTDVNFISVFLALSIVVQMIFLTISPAFLPRPGKHCAESILVLVKQSILQTCVYVCGLVCVCVYVGM